MNVIRQAMPDYPVFPFMEYYSWQCNTLNPSFNHDGTSATPHLLELSRTPPYSTVAYGGTEFPGTT